MVTRLIGVDTAAPKLPAGVVTATQGTTAADLAAGNHTHTAAAVGAMTKAEADATYVGLTGDTVTGDLSLNGGDLSVTTASAGFTFGVFDGLPAGTVSAQGNVYLETGNSGVPIEIGRSPSTPHKGALIFGKAEISSDNPLAITGANQLTTKAFTDSTYAKVSGATITGGLTVDPGGLFVGGETQLAGNLTQFSPGISALRGLTLDADPSAALGAATKQYVDANSIRPYLWLPGIAGNWINTPDPAALAGATALDIRWIERAPATGAAGYNNGWFINQASAATQGNMSFLAQGAAASANVSLWTATSGAPVLTSVAALRPTTGVAASRMTWRGSDGRVQFFNKVTTSVAAMMDNSGWTQVGANGTGAVGALIDIAQTMNIGGSTGTGAAPAIMNLYALSVSTAIDGTPFALWRSDMASPQFTDAYGARWTNQGTAWEWRDNAGNRLGVPPQGQLLTGTGYPEAVITAPVGTRYVDTAATNGAIKWVKATGTGNTGWKVTYGDTGWRKLSTWPIGGPVTGTALSAGWQNKADRAGGVWVRRVNDDVTWHVQGVEATTTNPSTIIPALSTGWSINAAPSSDNIMSFWCDLRAAAGGPTANPGNSNIAVIGASLSRNTANLFVAGEWIQHTSINYPCTQAWPATLPGTP